MVTSMMGDSVQPPKSQVTIIYEYRIQYYHYYKQSKWCLKQDENVIKDVKIIQLIWE